MWSDHLLWPYRWSRHPLLKLNTLNEWSSLPMLVGNCDNCVKQKIFVIGTTKWDKILLKPKVYDREKLRWIPWTFIKVLDKVCATFVHFSWHYWKLTKFSWYLAIFPSQLNNIDLKSFGLLQKLWDFMKVNDISRN